MQTRIPLAPGVSPACALTQCRGGGQLPCHRPGRWVAAAAEQETSASDAGDERADWAASIRSLTGRVKQRVWAPVLDPPPVLADVTVVLVSPKRPASVGTVARAMSCFECTTLRIVGPRCDHLVRSSRNASKGAQWLLWQAREYETLPQALEGVDASVAFTRWVNGRPAAYRSVEELMQAPQLADLVQPAAAGSSSSGGAGGGDAPARPRLALVFGREERGFDEGELDACSAVCSIPIGRLHESLSLSHAITIVLSQLFQRRGGLAFGPDQLVDGYGSEESR